MLRGHAFEKTHAEQGMKIPVLMIRSVDFVCSFEEDDTL